MAEYRTVRMTYWTDPYVEELEAEGKLLYLYLFTCTATNNLGIMEITRKRIAYETGIMLSSISALLEKLEHDKKIVIDGNLIWLTKFIKHQTSTSPKIIQSLRAIFAEVQSQKIQHEICLGYPHIFDDCDNKQYPNDTVDIPYPYPTDTPCIPSGELGSRKLEENTREKEILRARVEPAADEKPEDTAQPARQNMPQKTDAPSRGSPDYAAFKSCFAVYPVQQGEEEAWREWSRLQRNGTLAECYAVYDAILLLTTEDERWRDGYAPNMAKWLRGKGWNDKPFVKPEAQSRASPLALAGKARANSVHQERLAENQAIARELLKAKGIDFDEQGTCALDSGKIIDVQSRVSGSNQQGRAAALGV